jgi:hypothetical protein
MVDQAVERAALTHVLNLQREALIYKVSGVTETDARRVVTASSLTLLSLVKHSATWERRWFQVLLAGHRLQGAWPDTPDRHADATFDLSADDTIASVVAEYRAEIALAQLVIDTVDLDAFCADSAVADKTARDVILHMIEETARHAGHADIIRESIDGSRGRWPEELDGR